MNTHRRMENDMPHPVPEKKIFFDVSSIRDYLTRTTRYSGIQRVVANILAELLTRVPRQTMYLCYLDQNADRYVALCCDGVTADLTDPYEMLRLLHPDLPTAGTVPVLRKYRKQPLKYYYHLYRLDVAAMRGHEKSLRRYDMTIEQWKRERRGAPPRDTFSQNLSKTSFFDVAADGDDLILLDSSWADEFEAIFTQAKSSGLNVRTLVYDLIPILHPETTNDTMPLIFHDWLVSSVAYTTSYMTISEATKQDLEAFLDIYDRTFQVEVLALAQQRLKAKRDSAPANGPRTAAISEEGYPLLAQAAGMETRLRSVVFRPFVLVVGTIEMRKNVWRIAMAWKALIDAGHTDLPQLVFAGRLGWCRENFDALLDGTGNVYGYVHVFDGPTDDELTYLYERCLFTMMPSIYEGWGLPVGEALSYGKTAIVSNSSSLPEVGGDLVEYCDPNSVDSIAAAVRTLVATPERRRELEEKIAAARLRSWGDVAEDLLRIAG